jgi:hypothetical protein
MDNHPSTYHHKHQTLRFAIPAELDRIYFLANLLLASRISVTYPAL